MSNNKHIVRILISTWEGYSAGATHYYGKICYKGEYIEIKKILTLKEANELNKKDENLCYRKGEKSERFDSKESIVKKAKKIILDKWKKDVKLIIIKDYWNPNEVVWCYDNQLRIKLNRLWQKAEAMYAMSDDPWKLDKEKADKIWDDWEKIIKGI